MGLIFQMKYSLAIIVIKKFYFKNFNFQLKIQEKWRCTLGLFFLTIANFSHQFKFFKRLLLFEAMDFT